MRFTKELYNVTQRIGVKVVLTYGLGHAKCIVQPMYNLERLYMMQSRKTNYLVKRLGKIIGNMIQTEGVVLEKILYPAIDKAAFRSIQETNRLSSWFYKHYLRSFGGKTHTT